VSDGEVFRLTVARSALVEALQALGSFTPDDEAVFVRMVHRDGLLTLSSIGVASDVPTSGDWPRILTFSLANPASFAEKMPASDPVELTCGGGKLRIGRTALSVDVPANDVEPAPLAVGMSAFEMNVAIEKYGADRVKAAAGRHAVEKAIDAMHDALEEAWSHFRAFGMTQADLTAALRYYLKVRASSGDGRPA